MAMSGTVKILLIGGAAYLAYNWYINSQVAVAAAPVTPAPTPAPVPVTATAAPVTTTTPAPVTATPTPPPSVIPAPPAAAVSLAGPVTPNVNNSLTANVNVAGQVMNVTIIQSNGQAYDTGGHNITATLQSMGVNVASLLQQMQAAYALATKGVSGLYWFPPAMGLGRQQMRRPAARMVMTVTHTRPRRQPVALPKMMPANYVRAGAPMRRIGA